MLPNNHEESDSLMIHCLTVVEVAGKIVSIYSNDTDVFVTLLSNYHKFSMKSLLMHRSTNTWLDITKVYEIIGELKAKALIGFHCLKGCDTVEKSTGRSKGTSTVKCEEDILNAFTMLPVSITANVFSSLERFVCKIYSNSKMTTLKETCWKLYVQELKKKKKTMNARSKTIFEILPPTEGSFMQHLRHSHVQAKIFAEADKANIEKINPAQCGWKMLDKYCFVYTDECNHLILWFQSYKRYTYTAFIMQKLISKFTDRIWIIHIIISKINDQSLMKYRM